MQVEKNFQIKVLRLIIYYYFTENQTKLLHTNSIYLKLYLIFKIRVQNILLKQTFNLVKIKTN